MTDKIKFYINGEEAEAEPGQTIWQTAKARDVEIPHLCYAPKPDYRPDGNCRACMVEIEGERVLAASCLRTPTEGMKVITDSHRARTAQRMVMEMLVADQPPRKVRTIATVNSGNGRTGWKSATAALSPGPRTRRIPVIPPCTWPWTPAFNATCAYVPAAKSRSTT